MKIDFSLDPRGRCEALISENPDWELFDQVAELIVRNFNGRFLEKLNGLEQRYWDIEIEGEVLTLHLEHYLGISLFPQVKEANHLVKIVGNYLAGIEQAL